MAEAESPSAKRRGQKIEMDEIIIRRGLFRWRLFRLQEIEERMLELGEEFRAAQDGLQIIHRNPGQIADDITEYLWQKINPIATTLAELERDHEKLLGMDLPHLFVSFQRSKKKKSWPWETPQWNLETY